MALLVAGMFAMFFLGALYLQRVLGYTRSRSASPSCPRRSSWATMSLRFSERADHALRPADALIGGVFSILAGLLLFARTPVDGNYFVDLAPPMMLIGLGAGVGFPALMMLAMSGATPSDSGLASGLVNATVQVGGAIGLAVLATLAERAHRLAAGDGAASDVALNSGYHLAYLIGSGLVAAGSSPRSPSCGPRRCR